MNPISKTAFLCCGTRALDASSKHPLCNDIYAKEFMSPEGVQVFERFKPFKRPNISNAVRSRIVEDALRERIKNNPDLQIINIGAGFDSRAFRLTGGSWIEIDEPQIIELKNQKLPISNCTNPLSRFAVEFKDNQLETLLRTFDSSKETVFVIEGVFMYLEKQQIVDLLAVLGRCFSSHTLLCDLMDATFFHKHMQKMHAQIMTLGSQFRLIEVAPKDIFTAAGYGYSKPVSIVGRAVELKGFYVPSLILATVLKSLRDGYLIFDFTYQGRNSPAGSTKAA